MRLLQFVKLQLHDAIYRMRFYSSSFIHTLSLSNSHNNVASLQKNRGDKSHRVIVALRRLRYALIVFTLNSEVSDREFSSVDKMSSQTIPFERVGLMSLKLFEGFLNVHT